MGTSKSSVCNDIVKNDKIWITAAHILGAENVIAEHESRNSHKDSEWMQNSQYIKKQ